MRSFSINTFLKPSMHNFVGQFSGLNHRLWPKPFSVYNFFKYLYYTYHDSRYDSIIIYI